MTADTLHPAAAEYLQRLRRAGRRLPRGRLRELIVEIEGHLSEAIPPGATDAEAFTVLDKLGEPEAIIEAEAPGPAVLHDRRGTREWAAIILLLFGGFIFGVGWLAGLILLWSSRAWTTRDKWFGTLIVPGGLATVVIGLTFLVGKESERLCSYYGGEPQPCTGGTGGGAEILAVAIAAFLVLAPVATSVYLARRAR